jgi:hypothetical protein
MRRAVFWRPTSRTAHRTEVSASVAKGETSPSPGVPTRPAATGSSPAPSAELATLAIQVEADRPTAEESIGYWVPQISSKSVGMEVNGNVYDSTRILAEFRDAHRAYDAFLVRSDDYSTFQKSGYWVTLVPQRFADGRAAVSWCGRQRLQPGRLLREAALAHRGPRRHHAALEPVIQPTTVR